MDIEPEKTIIGFIGLGVMGKSMAGHILDAGFELHVYTRTKKSGETLLAQGAVWENSVSELSGKCDIIITIVGFPADVEEIYFGKNGILSQAKKETILIDMTTSSPDLAMKIYNKAKEKQIESLDAPVSGGDLGARNATLSIMVGGDKKTFDKVFPIFKTLGKNIELQGKAGAGQHTKMANQIALATGMIGVCESLAYAEKSGLDPETVLKSIGQGAAGSWSLNNMGPRMIAGNFDPGFYIKHFIKDMNIAAESSKSLGLATPGLDLVLSLYKKMADDGFEDYGTQALYKLFK
ncbi:MAG: NAD(P)-dependent oxidoreductase [Deltaproteobacteria bacterium]|jgi:3-hydroxyisobutyrate dehydrogenase|nr:NAD(P)-dependent oxidoreductase [Deltaproteobacteria bacterium]